MKKHLLTLLLTLFIIAGTAPMALASTPCSGSSSCPMDKSASCPYKVLTKKECRRFCKAKSAAIAAKPSLAKSKDVCTLCNAITKEDASMKAICMKVKKSCDDTLHCTDPECMKATKKKATP